MVTTTNINDTKAGRLMSAIRQNFTQTSCSMKRFFPELASCFSGSPTVQTIANEAPSRRRRMTHRRSRKHWTPALAAIEEDAALREVRRQSAESAAAFRSENKPLIKRKFSGKNRSDSYGYDDRKSSESLALPAFSPTPFVF